MERFSLFEGLKGLRAVNLTNGKAQLPKVGGRQKGIVGDAIKTGDRLYCDLVSMDIWLDVIMQLLDVRIKLQFEVKVLNRVHLTDLISMLVSIANLFLESSEIDLKYDFADVKLEKRISDVNKDTRLLKKTQDEVIPNEVEMVTFPLNYTEDTKVESNFHFLDRKLLCQLLKEREIIERYSREGTSESTPFLVMSDAVVNDTDMTRLRAFPIRNFRKETLLVQSSTFELQSEENQKGEGLRRVCCCSIV